MVSFHSSKTHREREREMRGWKHSAAIETIYEEEHRSSSAPSLSPSPSFSSSSPPSLHSIVNAWFLPLISLLCYPFLLLHFLLLNSKFSMLSGLSTPPLNPTSSYLFMEPLSVCTRFARLPPFSILFSSKLFANTLQHPVN